MLAAQNADRTDPRGKDRVKVWDPFVRVAHWTVAASFFVAYFTEDELMSLHAWAGYVIGLLIVLRVAWGFVGPTHARFSDFLFGPLAAAQYVTRLLTFRARRYVGHSPAGAVMVFALLAGLAATVWTGMELYAAEERKGPLAATSGVVSVAIADEDEEGDERDDEGGGNGYGELWEELHEVLANLMMVLVVLHVGGVALASVAHRENLVRAMVTGWKRAE